MPFRFKAGEPIRENIVRIVTEELDSAVDHLSRASTDHRDEAIHEARKSIKKIRGVLRLLRPELGKRYGKENQALRNTGRGLSELRDAGAIISTFEDVQKKFQNELQKNVFQGTRRALHDNKRTTEETLNVLKVMEQSARALRRFKNGVASWPISSDGFSAIAAGLKATYKDGRKAMHTAVSTGRPDRFHEWRKRAKDHWYHIRLIQDISKEAMEARERDLHDLESCLGDDHNLLVLCDQMRADPDRYGGSESVALFTALAKQEQQQLRQTAISLGERAYLQRPRNFVANLEALWNIREDEARQPKSERKPTSRQTKKSAAAGTHAA